MEPKTTIYKPKWLISFIDHQIIASSVSNYNTLMENFQKHSFYILVRPFLWFYDIYISYLKGGSRRVWPVSRGCSLLRGTWSHLRICRRSVLPYTRIVIAFWIMITFYTLLPSLFCISDARTQLHGCELFHTEFTSTVFNSSLLANAGSYRESQVYDFLQYFFFR